VADICEDRLLPADSREAIGSLSAARPPKRDRADRPRPIASHFCLLLIRIVSRLSLAAAHRIGAVAGLLFSIVPTRLRDAGLTNLRIAFPGLSDRELLRLGRKCSVQAGHMLFELPALWAWPGERVIELVREVEGRELLDAAIARGNGVVVVTPHIGAWEMMLLWMGHVASLTAPFRELRLPELEEFVHAARQRTGTHMVPGQRFAARSLLRALRDGSIVGMAPDQDAGSGSGVFVPLFHEVANTGVLIPRLVQKSGATMLWVFAERLEHGKGFRMHIEAADPDMGSADIVRSARAMNRDIESIVTRFPEQYLWFYKRYRRRPEGCLRKVYTKGAWRSRHNPMPDR
jgi:KDO2-lipid IV(A) lauroyltransferase